MTRQLPPKPHLQAMRKELDRWPQPAELSREAASLQLKIVQRRLATVMQHQYKATTPSISSEAANLLEKLNRRRVALEAHIAQVKEVQQATKATTTVERPTQKLPWRVLGEAAPSFPELRAYLKDQQAGQAGHEAVYDMERLGYLCGLEPTKIYKGLDEFEGYLVFYFQQHHAAVLECAKVGNAIYVLYGSWSALARKSKAALLQDQSGSVRRIIHVGDWRHRLEEALTRTALPASCPSASTARHDAGTDSE